MSDYKMEAKQVFATMCQALDNRNWRYDKIEGRLGVRFGVKGDDIPMDFLLLIDEEKGLVQLFSPLMFEICEDKRVEAAVAVNIVNLYIVNGNFDFDLRDGKIVYRMTSCFRGSKIGEELFHYLLSAACSTVDDYNDDFLMLNKGQKKAIDFLKEAK